MFFCFLQAFLASIETVEKISFENDFSKNINFLIAASELATNYFVRKKGVGGWSMIIPFFNILKCLGPVE